MSNNVYIIGNVGADPELRYTSAGKPVLNFSIADTPRRKNQQTGEWEDAGETLWLNVTLWDRAEETAGQVKKGDRVQVFGTLKARSFETKQGEKRTVIEATASTVGVLPKTQQGAGWSKPAQNDPWGGDNVPF